MVAYLLSNLTMVYLVVLVSAVEGSVFNKVEHCDSIAETKNVPPFRRHNQYNRKWTNKQ